MEGLVEKQTEDARMKRAINAQDARSTNYNRERANTKRSKKQRKVRRRAGLLSLRRKAA